METHANYWNLPGGWTLSSSSSSLNFSLGRLDECEWLWPPFITRTIFSTNKNTKMPAKIHIPTLVSLLWSCASSWDGEWALQDWPWSWWWSSSWWWWCVDNEWGIKCKKASPNSPPDAKLKSIFKNDSCSSLWSIGMKKSTKNGTTLMATVDASALAHSVRSNTGGFDWTWSWTWSWPWSWWPWPWSWWWWPWLEHSCGNPKKTNANNSNQQMYLRHFFDGMTWSDDGTIGIFLVFALTQVAQTPQNDTRRIRTHTSRKYRRRQTDRRHEIPLKWGIVDGIVVIVESSALARRWKNRRVECVHVRIR